MCVEGVGSKAELLELARSLGRPIPSPTGEIVKELSPKPTDAARPGTFSHSYGTGSFPLHTDTAFWTTPSRLVVLRGTGDLRRHTTLLSFADLLADRTGELLATAERSVWRARIPSGSFYCSMKFGSGNQVGWRYDAQCMSPANRAAVTMQQILSSRLLSVAVQQIQWTGTIALVLQNWQVLHGRGPAPNHELNRIVERIYVA